MKEEWHKRYEQLNLDLTTSPASAGLYIAEKHWDALKKAMIGYCFNSVEEEVYFFKTVKPFFTAKILFFHLMQAGIRNPLLGLRKFKQKNANFYRYYTSAQTDKDTRWFVEVSGLTSRHDHKVAQLLALQELAALAFDMKKCQKRAKILNETVNI